ncbi:uncharacterized protein C8R40DRAFT_1111780 [Lentinula edodes]|uniref:uncharacterized protein n=1 Tax=Lentinula edodes TaxID=5353 RepID=UPI001E8E363A|nr:uncharacterized protein C8R40DRAFT_1111780 [Lentinula edodes]KAH7873797.1 hypothetical protein C8R40DRAFT_1111780 [Lentinula edodes]
MRIQLEDEAAAQVWLELHGYDPWDDCDTYTVYLGLSPVLDDPHATIIVTSAHLAMSP